MPKNILLVTEPGVDGVFRYVEALASYLMEHGALVHLAYSDRRGSTALHQLVERIETNGGRTANLRTANKPAPSDFRAFLTLRKLAREVKPDVIHSHSSKAGALARMLPFAGVWAPLAHHPHAYFGMRPVRGKTDFIYDTIERVLGRWSTTFACSPDEQTYAIERLGLPRKRVELIVNGVNTSRFAPASYERRCELRARFGLPVGGVVLGAMGRASWQKDPVTLYNAFAEALKTRPNLTLFHVGQGELDADIERIVDERGLRGRVVRLSYLATPPDFHQAVDGFFLPSRYEGFSYALLEALSSNLPLIISDAPGNTSLLRAPLSHRWSAQIGDVTGFARAIVEWADECARPRRGPSNHRALALEYYDMRQCFGRVLALYDRLVQQRGRVGALATEAERASRPA